MDDEAVIEAEIAQQLEQINLDVDDFQYEENDEEFEEGDLDIPLEEVVRDQSKFRRKQFRFI
jgi:hypothetical protein